MARKPRRTARAATTPKGVEAERAAEDGSPHSSWVRLEENYKGKLQPMVSLQITDEGIVGKEYLDEAIEEARRMMRELSTEAFK